MLCTPSTLDPRPFTPTCTPNHLPHPPQARATHQHPASSRQLHTPRHAITIPLARARGPWPACRAFSSEAHVRKQDHGPWWPWNLLSSVTPRNPPLARCLHWQHAPGGGDRSRRTNNSAAGTRCQCAGSSPWVPLHALVDWNQRHSSIAIVIGR